MSLTPEQVDHIARLSRLDLSDEEKASFQKQLSDILEYVGQLSAVDTAGVEPLMHTTPVVNGLRDDVVTPSDDKTTRALIESFPERDGDLVKVKAVFS